MIFFEFLGRLPRARTVAAGTWMFLLQPALTYCRGCLASQVELERAASIMLEADSLGRNKLLARDIHNARPYFQAKVQPPLLPCCFETICGGRVPKAKCLRK